VLTLFTTPVVYLFFDRIGRKYLKTGNAAANLAASRVQHHVVAGD
jgi:multidrug efflux pump